MTRILIRSFLYLVFAAVLAQVLYLEAKNLPTEQLFSERGYTEILQAAMLLDIAEGAIRGELFDPWYYLLFMGGIMVLAAIPLVMPRPAVVHAMGWILFVIILSWSAGVRTFLVS